MKSMMQLAGVSTKYAHECSLDEFIRQSEQYRDLDQDGLNQVYKFLFYNGGQGMMLSHPFPVERIQYLKEWNDSVEYSKIRSGNYQQATAEGSVNVKAEKSQDEVDDLRRQIEELQNQINRIKFK
jgi:hypothetical protein